MALLWLEGFERFGSVNDSILDNTEVNNLGYDGSITQLKLKDGRHGGKSLFFDDSAYIRKEYNDITKTYVVGFNFLSDVGATQDSNLFWYGSTNSPSIAHCKILLTSSGKLQVYQAGTLVGTVDFVFGSWHYLEIKVKPAATGGILQVRLNNTQIVSATGDVNNASVSPHSFHFATTLDGHHTRIDDLYICDTTGSTNNDFLGSLVVETLMPGGAGDSTQFTPSTGSNFQNVDEVYTDGDTTYNESSTVGHSDYYDVGNLSSLTGTVHGIFPWYFARKTDITDYTVAAVLYDSDNMTDNNLTSHTLNHSGYEIVQEIKELNPDSGSAWAISEINALQLGITITA